MNIKESIWKGESLETEEIYCIVWTTWNGIFYFFLHSPRAKLDCILLCFLCFLTNCIVAKISKLVDQCCWALRRQKQSPDQMLNSTGNQTTNAIHQLSISLNKGEQQLLQTKLKISRNSWNIPVSQSGERFGSGVQTIYCMGVLMLFQGPRLGKLVSFT